MVYHQLILYTLYWSNYEKTKKHNYSNSSTHTEMGQVKTFTYNNINLGYNVHINI